MDPPPPELPAGREATADRVATRLLALMRQLQRRTIDRAALAARWYWLTPLFAIVLFIGVMLALFYALRQDEVDRQHQTLYRDVEWAQQAILARLQTNQDEVIALTRDFGPEASKDEAFRTRAREAMRAHPAILTIAWIDASRIWRRVIASDILFDGGPHDEGDDLEGAASRAAFEAARERHLPTYSAPYAADRDTYLELHVPVYDNDEFGGTVVAVTSVASLARAAVPKEATQKYTVMLVDASGRTLAGMLGAGSLPGDRRPAFSVDLPLGAPVSDMTLRVTAYHTRSNLTENFLVWAVVALSLFIVWSLWSLMRHVRRRQEAEVSRDRIFNLSLDILAVMDRQGHIVRLNPACARVLGRDPATLTGASLLDLVHPDDRAATEAELQRLAAGRASTAFENRCRRFNPDGTTEYRWLTWAFNPDIQARGDKRLLYAVAHDMTQRRARQQALLAETNFRRAMEDSMLTGMRALDMHGRITYVNPAFCRMLGYDERELLGASLPFPYWPRESVAENFEMMHSLLAGKTPPSGIEVRVRHRDGLDFDVRMYVSPLVDANGVQSGWMTSMTDITASKQARQELAAAQERFTTVLDELDAAVSVCSVSADTSSNASGSADQGENQAVLFANRYYRRLYGNDAAGHRELSTAPGLSAGMAATLATTERDGAASEVFSVSADRWFEVRTRIIQWVDGSLVQMQVATDITARMETQERARKQEEKVQLTSRLITMGEMASSLAHELNQPLTAIANYSMGTVARVRSAIAGGPPTDPTELLAMLQKTSSQAERAGNIIRRIREFVKRSEPRKRHCRIRAIVDDAVGFAEIDAAKKRIAIRTRVPDDIADIDADAILIEQVLLNLLKNAAEAMSDAPTRIGFVREVIVDVRDVPAEADGADGRTRGGYVEFAIIDCGAGIAAEVRDKLFEPFYSTKPEGMGMGLNICRSIVEFHHGRLWATANANGGTTFRFTLPRPDPSTHPMAPEVERVAERQALQRTH